jgi:hypothetical protein
MAKKQTRRSISVSRTTYERLKAFCETNHISMSQLVETRVNDFLVASGANDVVPGAAPGGATSIPSRPAVTMTPRPASTLPPRPSEPRAGAMPTASSPPAVSSSSPAHPPMTSAAARFAIEPPPPIIKPRQETAAPKPAEKRPEQIFTF